MRAAGGTKGVAQDPYCVRCIPQVMGACFDQLSHAAKVIQTEANAWTDNPMVDLESGDIINGGNFHAEPVGFACDGIALAIAEIGAMSERRIALLTDPRFSKLPAFLASGSGLDSGSDGPPGYGSCTSKRKQVTSSPSHSGFSTHLR